MLDCPHVGQQYLQVCEPGCIGGSHVACVSSAGPHGARGRVPTSALFTVLGGLQRLRREARDTRIDRRSATRLPVRCVERVN